jgi:hypothetical protein
MRPDLHSYTPAAANLTGFLSNATGAPGAGWVLTATTAADCLAHLVTIRNDSVTDHSAKTAILTGTDADGKAQTETVNLPGTSATVTSTKYFKTLTSVVPSATIGADTMDIGWSAVAISATYPIDGSAEVACNIYADITGTINFSIQQSFANIQSDTTYMTSFSAITALAAKSADTAGQANVGATAIRLLINSVTAGATVAMYTSQPSNV